MRTYLTNILPRIQRFNQSLDKKELLIDQPWVLLDEDGNKQQYIFERGGNLIMSLNGLVQYGKWRYIPSSNSLLIDRSSDSVLLNHQFFNEALCVLKRDGYMEDPWVLVNERLIPDLDTSSYLNTLLENRPNRPNISFKESIKDDEDSDVVRRTNLLMGGFLLLIVIVIIVIWILRRI